ncbi:SDR family NAD(P)-dependent oxidoreductase [Virgisporangium aurantiacum]
MTGSLIGRVGLVVGGGADGPAGPRETLPLGNGRAIAISAARAGALVMVADRDAVTAEATAAAIRAEGGAAASVACDVSVAEDCMRAVAATVEQFGALHLLVNNVGIADLGSIRNTAVEDFDRVLAVNVRGQFLTMQAALPALLDAGDGAIVNVSSINAIRHHAGIGYETSKAALLGLSRHVAVTTAKRGIRVNTVLPGLIDSTMRRRYADLVTGGAVTGDPAARVPLGRLGSPWEVAAVVVFLLSADASYLSGAEIVVDGGITNRL